MAKRKQPSELEAIIGELAPLTERAIRATPELSPRKLKQVRNSLAAAGAKLREAAERLDPVLRPDSVFDPTDPNTAGRIVALTLVAQDRHPLSSVPDFYGAGVYAIYYKGLFDAYEPLSGKDHPIYVGKADPDVPGAKGAVAQGTALSERLSEHAKSIRSTSTLDIGDFECRFLIVQSGFQTSAEDYLIDFFKPIWNWQTRVAFGIGKHGDSSETRGNKRSPWDTLHPGRAWATNTTDDQKAPELVREQIATHLAKHPPYEDIHAIFDSFVTDMRQLSSERFRSRVQPEAITAAEAFKEEAADNAGGPAD